MGEFLFQLGMGSDTEMQYENMMSPSLAFVQKPPFSCTMYIPKPVPVHALKHLQFK